MTDHPCATSAPSCMSAPCCRPTQSTSVRSASTTGLLSPPWRRTRAHMDPDLAPPPPARAASRRLSRPPPSTRGGRRTRRVDCRPRQSRADGHLLGARKRLLQRRAPLGAAGADRSASRRGLDQVRPRLGAGRLGSSPPSGREELLMHASHDDFPSERTRLRLLASPRRSLLPRPDEPSRPSARNVEKALATCATS